MFEESLEPVVDFDCNDRSFNSDDWLTFWDSTRSWLAEQGYTLFEFGYHWGKEYKAYPTYWVQKLSNPSDSDVKHPFAKYGGDKEGIPTPPLSGGIIVGLFIYFPLLSTFSQRSVYSRNV